MPCGQALNIAGGRSYLTGPSEWAHQNVGLNGALIHE